MARTFSEGKAGRRPRAWRTRCARLLSMAVVVAAGLTVIAVLQAVHDDGFFELDRNAVSNPAVPGDDWDAVFAGTSTADAAVFFADGEGPTIFRGGASKDDLDTTGWQHTSGATPDKDELLNAYAARYGNNVYFGADRTANNGDAVMGFWFFQQEVVPAPNGTFGPGRHQDGDLLVLSDFSGGGGVVTIRVFRWNGPDGDIPGVGAINGTLDMIAGQEGVPADCVGPPSVGLNDAFCATVNNAVVPAPWPFDPKVGGPGFFQVGEFYEGGIDLAFLGVADRCFASFLAESRASTSVDSVLKDFVGGTFERCVSTVKTTPSDADGNPVTQIFLGQSIHDHALITGTGSTITPTGTMTFSICSPTQLTNGACETGGTVVSTNTVTPIVPATNPPTAEALSAAFTPDLPGTWCWRGEYSGDDNYPPATDASAGECFQVLQLQPRIEIAQVFTVTASATITVPVGAGNLAGSLVFELFLNDPTCAGSAILTATRTIGGGTLVNVTSDTLDITLPGSRTLSWRVTYTSANPGHRSLQSACNNASATLTFTNDLPQP